MRLWQITACCVGIALTVPALAMADSARFEIKAEPLPAALKAFAQQSHMQLLYEYGIVRDLKGNSVVGVIEKRAALEKLLRDTGLEPVFSSDNAATIRPARASRPMGKGWGKEGKTASSDTFRVAGKAQEVPPETAPVEQNPGGGSAAADRSGVLEEVIVTAQKRTEDIQKVPLSISAISSDTLNTFHYTQLSDFAATIPGLQVDSGGAPGFHTVTIRGITTGNQYGSTTTAMYVDDVPVGPSGSYSYGASFDGIDLLPYDLDHVEVLKGPQGTLYGASSMGGLVKYVLGVPSLTVDSLRFGADGSAIDGGTGVGYGARAAANVVISPDHLALTLSGAHEHTPGYITNIQNGQSGINRGSQDGARAGIYWKPIAPLAVRLDVLINHSDFANVSQIPVTASGEPVYGRFDAKYFFRNGIKVNDRLYSANVSYDFGWATLTSVTGYFDANSNLPEDADIYTFLTTLGGGSLIPAVDDLGLKKFSQEVRLSSARDRRLAWTVGGFYTRERASLFEKIDVLIPATLQPNPLFDPLEDLVRSSTFKETAAYANATFRLTRRWDVNAGIRYSGNDQTVSNTSSGISLPTYSSSDSSTTYSFSSRYFVSDHSMAYFRVATGYRPGGSNMGLPGTPATFGPDKLTSYDLGVKSRALQRHLQIDADVFHIDWKDIQIAEYTTTGLRQIYTGNAGSATSDGLEIAAEYVVTPSFRVGVNGALNNAKLTTDAPAIGGVNGDRLPLSAKWSGSVTADWRHALENSLALSADAVWRYVGDRNTDFPPANGSPGGSNYLHFDAYDTLDLSMGLSWKATTWRLYCKNVGNSYAYLRYYAPMATVLEPRTVGLSVDAEF